MEHQSAWPFANPPGQKVNVLQPSAAKPLLEPAAVHICDAMDYDKIFLVFQ
jgi:hypothetical protein